jgi:MFS transporter, putative metabolite:H+ symporter
LPEADHVLHELALMKGRRRNALVFWFGCGVVTLGVILHLPMYLMGAPMHYALAGMPMDTGMYFGMAAILAGLAMACYGLLPNIPASENRVIETIAPPEDAPLTKAHWGMAALLAVALIIDIMKPASLGFVTPGMKAEYGVDKAMVAWLPLSALTGTTLGSFIWGWLADIYGRRAAILLSSVMFIGTSICGAMPDFWWNVFMCLLMGMAAGGMLPVAYALLAEIMPTKHRGWMLVLIGGIGSVGGYFAASFLSQLLQPEFSWRIMWFLNMPTGLILIALSPLLPESARFLQQMGRGVEARAVLARFGAVVKEGAAAGHEDHSHIPPIDREFLGRTGALTIAALSWSLVNFGLLLWLPSALVAEGRSVAESSKLIANSTLISMPVVLVSAYLYAVWSTKWSLVTMAGVMTLGLMGFLLRSMGFEPLADPRISLTLVIVGSSGVISILLPYTAENYPIRIRARATGWIAGCSKLGGLIAQGLAVLGAAPPFGIAAFLIAIPTTAGLALVAWLGRETRGRDLREIDSGKTFAAGRKP